MCPSLYWSDLLILLSGTHNITEYSYRSPVKLSPSLMRHVLLYDFILLSTVHLIVHGYLVLQLQITLLMSEGTYLRNSLITSLGMGMLNIRSMPPKCARCHSQVVMHASKYWLPYNFTTIWHSHIIKIRVCKGVTTTTTEAEDNYSNYSLRDPTICYGEAESARTRPD